MLLNAKELFQYIQFKSFAVCSVIIKSIKMFDASLKTYMLHLLDVSPRQSYPIGTKQTLLLDGGLVSLFVTGRIHEGDST